MNGTPNLTVEFGDFTFDLQNGDLRRRGLSVKMTPQAGALLRILLSFPLRAHSREEICDELWRGRTSKNAGRSLNKVILSVRRAIRGTGRNGQVIETIRRFGYRFPPQSLHTNSERKVSFQSKIGSSVAVLPIQVSVANCPELSYIGGRITSLLTDVISGVPGVRVLAERIVRHRLANSGDPWNLGGPNGIHVLLSGELLRHLQETILRIKLIDARDGVHLFATEVEVSSPFGTQSRQQFADEISEKLRPALEKLADKSSLEETGKRTS
jgi:DNA-binding winged helix-turn-helix (wHTH) protein